jgi:hypothetical protein
MSLLIPSFFAAAGIVELILAAALLFKGKKAKLTLQLECLAQTPPPPPDYLAPPGPPPPGPAYFAPPKISYYSPPKTEKQKHDFRLTIRGQTPKEPTSFIGSKLFILLGILAAVLFGVIAYFGIFLPLV